METERMDSSTLLCPSANYKLVNFEEVVQDKRWEDLTEEVQPIKKDNVWDHVLVSKDRKSINGK